ncbi:transcriptional regulator [Candidatus Endobugula sertula]|uniref:Transcriptional regulator n=1 Tax=Candidatus Endobugula sertula TaxID=62101 RepID=A0A1D2QMI9_9GAMM|nr:transcriptional regulator [Candidatus Endobugula sertula]
MTLLIENFKRFYQDHRSMDLSRMDEIYAEDIVFRDPLHRIQGLPILRDTMNEMYANLSECRFEYLDQLVTHDSAYIKWNMHYRHPKLGNTLISVRGVSQIQFSELIDFHEDIYDMGELLYEHVPMMGGLVRWLKKRLVRHSG